MTSPTTWKQRSSFLRSLAVVSPLFPVGWAASWSIGLVLESIVAPIWMRPVRLRIDRQLMTWLVEVRAERDPSASTFGYQVRHGFDLHPIIRHARTFQRSVLIATITFNMGHR